ncbi:MAG: hypothetical protein NTU97_04510, partial [Candidatus Magasanikbacteria bacterium]|nr:hypothetical protein [Candidatus Magasanikbacteria bacterium]
INKLAKKYQEQEKENPLIAFENSLEWANRELRENFETKELGQISIIFGSLRDEHLQFSAGGNIHSFIFYRENGEYQSNDLIKNYASENNDPNIFFANLISGVIHQNNFTLFATPTVLNYLTLDRVQKIITSNKTDEICSRLENLLSEIENKVAFGGILLSWPESKESTPLTSSFKLTPNESINRLLKKQRETDQIMSPAVFQSIKKYLQNRKNKKTSSTQQEDIQTLKKITKIYTRLTGWQGRISNAWQKILIALGQIIYKTFLFIKTILAKIIRIDFKSPSKFLSGLKTIGYESLLFIARPITKIKNKFLSLSLKKRLLYILTFLACLALAISLSLAFLNQKENSDSTNYNQLVNLIKTKITEAESSLIYKNEDAAKQLTKEVKDLLTTLPTDTTDRKKTKDDLTAALQPLAYKLQKIQTVDSNLELDLKQLHLDQEPTSFIKTSSNFIFFVPNL